MELTESEKMCDLWHDELNYHSDLSENLIRLAASHLDHKLEFIIDMTYPIEDSVGWW